ncbi:helix-turn-helix domain-containing protein [Streptomyces sp. NPDC047123]|uniref:helix-turn-helix domain-containing protein n=1 Tax=Streptomyces sp. NPDC047123 TaxID=3155622 RepID=UPI0033FD4FF4
MGSREFVRTVPRLDGMVVSATGYRTAGQRPALHRGLPSPWLTVIFSLDGPIATAATPEAARGTDAVRTDIVVSGLHQSPAYVVQPEHEAGIQLAVHPLAARALLGLPAAALAGELVTPGTDVFGGRADDVRAQLCALDRWPDRFALLSGYLRRRAAGADAGRVRPEVAEAWAWLARHRGAGTLGGLSRHVALGERRLTTLFRAETGLTPKQAARLMRFEHARAAVTRAVGGGGGGAPPRRGPAPADARPPPARLLRIDHARAAVTRAVGAGAPPDLARVAADTGYCDHSHLVRDFRRYTGASPTGWLAEECRNIQAREGSGGEEWGHEHHRTHP